MEFFFIGGLFLGLLFVAILLRQVMREQAAKEQVYTEDGVLLEKDHEGSIRSIDENGNTLEFRFRDNFSERDDIRYQEWLAAFEGQA